MLQLPLLFKSVDLGFELLLLATERMLRNSTHLQFFSCQRAGRIVSLERACLLNLLLPKHWPLPISEPIHPPPPNFEHLFGA